MEFVLYDGGKWANFLPFTYSRPVAEIRTGIWTIREKWEHFLGETIGTLTEDYLQNRFPKPKKGPFIVINATVMPNNELVESIKKLGLNESLMEKDRVLAYASGQLTHEIDPKEFTSVQFDGEVDTMDEVWEIFSNNDREIKRDLAEITKGRTSEPLHESNLIFGDGEIFIEKGANIKGCTLNTEDGPIYIGQDALVMEGCHLRGSLAVCDNAVIKMGAKIYGQTTFGPYSKVAGEINNSVIFGYTSKGHEGYLGNSVLGEWCNIGADTNNSNLKNNYSKVSIWNYPKEELVSTGLQFCGLFMGDHAKVGINTMFNTGTVVGMAANVFGSGFPPKFVPSFSWGGADGFNTFRLDKAYETATAMMKRRNKEFDSHDRGIFDTVFEKSKIYRKY